MGMFCGVSNSGSSPQPQPADDPNLAIQGNRYTQPSFPMGSNNLYPTTAGQMPFMGGRYGGNYGVPYGGGYGMGYGGYGGYGGPVYGPSFGNYGGYGGYGGMGGMGNSYYSNLMYQSLIPLLNNLMGSRINRMSFQNPATQQPNTTRYSQPSSQPNRPTQVNPEYTSTPSGYNSGFSIQPLDQPPFSQPTNSQGTPVGGEPLGQPPSSQPTSSPDTSVTAYNNFKRSIGADSFNGISTDVYVPDYNKWAAQQNTPTIFSGLNNTG